MTSYQRQYFWKKSLIIINIIIVSIFLAAASYFVLVREDALDFDAVISGQKKTVAITIPEPTPEPSSEVTPEKIESADSK